MAGERPRRRLAGVDSHEVECLLPAAVRGARFEAEGEAGLEDRTSRPKRSPNRTPRHRRRQCIRLRRQRRWGADHIGHELGLASSTVQNILHEAGLGRLDVGDRATKEPVRRYERDRPGELVHVDIKKIAAIPDGGGWRAHGRGNDGHGGHSGAGYRLDGVVPDSPAEKAGLRKGDVIVEIDGQRIAGIRDVSKILRALKPGQKVGITYTRDSTEHHTEARLSRR